MTWFKSSIFAKLLMLGIALALIGGIGLGCAQIGARSQGWSGGIVTDGKIIFGSMKGKVIALSTADGSRVWEGTLESEESGGGFGCTPVSSLVVIYGTPAVSGDWIYVGAYNGIIYAVNATTGQSQRFYPPEGNLRPIVGSLVEAEGKIYLGGADGKVYAFDSTTYAREWEFTTGDKIWSAPELAGDTLYIGSFDKRLYALNVSDGSLRWNPFEAEGAIATTPLVYNNTIYFGALDRQIYAVSADDGSLRWKSRSGNWFWAKIVAINNIIYAPCLDGKVYALDAENGNKVAEFDLGSPISSSPVIVNGSIIVATEGGRVFSLDTANRTKRLLANVAELADEELAIRSPLSTSEGIVFVHAQTKDHGSLLYALNAVTGIDLWRYPISSK